MSKQDSAKKYKFTNENLTFDGITLHHFHALRDFDDIKGDYLGGYIKKEKTIP